MSISTRWLKRIWFAAAGLWLLVFLPSCLVYVVSPGQWWPMGILSIGYLLTWASGLIITISAFWINKKLAVLVCLLLVVGWAPFGNSLALHKSNPFELRKKAGDLRMVHWNARGPGGNDAGKPKMVVLRGQAVAFLKELNADIICLPDFNETKHPLIWSNIALFADSLGFSYHVFDRHYFEHDWGADIHNGLALFSKWPIVQQGSLKYPGRKYPETILWADVQTPRGILRVISTHLQSTHISRNDADTLPIPYYLDTDTTLIRAGTTLQKLKHYQRYHVRQAEMLRAFLDTCAVPAMLAADLNSVPASWVYRHIRGGWSDVFSQLGRGVEATYPATLPWLRIDYLLTNTGVKARQFGQFRLPISDHDLLVADVEVGFPVPVE